MASSFFALSVDYFAVVDTLDDIYFLFPLFSQYQQKSYAGMPDLPKQDPMQSTMEWQQDYGMDSGVHSGATSHVSVLSSSP